MANSKAVAAAGNATSDAFTLAATTVAAWIQLKADNAGTPARAVTSCSFVSSKHLVIQMGPSLMSMPIQNTVRL